MHPKSATNVNHKATIETQDALHRFNIYAIF